LAFAEHDDKVCNEGFNYQLKTLTVTPLKEPYILETIQCK